MFNVSFKPSLSLKPPKLRNGKGCNYSQEDKITIFPAQLWHITEIHTLYLLKSKLFLRNCGPSIIIERQLFFLIDFVASYPSSPLLTISLGP